MSGFANIKGRVYTVSTLKHLKTKICVQQVDSPLYNKYECTTSGTWKAKSNSCSVANLISATTTKQSVPDSVFYADIQIICESFIVCCFFQNKNVTVSRFLALSLSRYLYSTIVKIERQIGLLDPKPGPGGNFAAYCNHSIKITSRKIC